MNVKTKAARVSIISNCILIMMKFAVGTITGSVSIISEAVHSSMDLLAAIIAFFSVRVSDKPADEMHPYGHGKYENVSGVIEALLIFLASVLIIIEAIKKILHPGSMESIGLGFLVMVAAAGVNTLVSRHLYKIAKQEDSIALEADALHLKTDVLTSLGVGGGLLLIWITKLEFLDPIVAIGVAIFILKESYELLKTAFTPLLDVTLSDKEISLIENVMSSYDSVYCDFHDLKTRKSGSSRYIDMHLVFPPYKSVKEAHDTCDRIEADLGKRLNHTHVMIHLEPCDNVCLECRQKEDCKI